MYGTWAVAVASKLHEEYAELDAYLELEKRRRAALDELEVETMDAEELEVFHGLLTELRNAASVRSNQLMRMMPAAMQRPYQRLLHLPVPPFAASDGINYIRGADNDRISSFPCSSSSVGQYCYKIMRIATGNPRPQAASSVAVKTEAVHGQQLSALQLHSLW